MQGVYDKRFALEILQKYGKLNIVSGGTLPIEHQPPT